MNRKVFLILPILLIAVLFCAAQNEQRGLVRTIGRPGSPGKPISNVVIRVQGY